MLGVAIQFGTLDYAVSSTNFAKYGRDYSVARPTGIEPVLRVPETRTIVS